MPEALISCKVDPELRRLLGTAATRQSVDAVVTLDEEASSFSPEHTVRLVAEIMGRVASHVGSDPRDVHVLPNIGSVVVSAQPAFLQELISQPEIVCATANCRTESAFIPPHASHAVTEEEIFA